MKTAFKFIGWTVLAVTLAAVVVYAFAAKVEWLQWLIASGVAVWVVGTGFSDYEEQRRAENERLHRRLDSLEYLCRTTRDLLDDIDRRLP